MSAGKSIINRKAEIQHGLRNAEIEYVTTVGACRALGCGTAVLTALTVAMTWWGVAAGHGAGMVFAFILAALLGVATLVIGGITLFACAIERVRHKIELQHWREIYNDHLVAEMMPKDES